MDSQTETHKDQDQQNPSGYEPTWPKDLDLYPIHARDISHFIIRFFEVSDNPDLTEEWLSFFHEEAKLVMGDKVAEGKEEIRTLRKGMWEKVKARKHTVQKVFPGVFPLPGQLAGGGGELRGAGNLGFMVYGTVVYTLRETGEEDGMDWAAHGELIMTVDGNKEGKWDGEASMKKGNTSPYVFGRYRVYLSPGV